LLRYECRESWPDEDDARHAAKTESATEALQALMGHDNFTPRQRIARKFRRAGLDTFVLPSDSDIDKIVRYERLIKRNLYRALYTLERIRATRRQLPSSDRNQSSPVSLGHEPELLDENKF
jgi:hypothetical protein